jgi:hypothetical protein
MLQKSDQYNNTDINKNRISDQSEESDIPEILILDAYPFLEILDRSHFDKRESCAI